MKILATAAVILAFLAGPVFADGTATVVPATPVAAASTPVAATPAPPTSLRKASLVEVLSIDGVIDDSTATYLKNKIEEINENPHVKAILLTLDTPGGGSSASAAAREELGKANVPVIVWCDSLCASGGIYISSAKSVKFIAIRKHTIAGSVGVIAHLRHYERLLDWARVDSVTFKSGSVKDEGNPEHAPTPDELSSMQTIVDKLAGEFYAVVAEARGDKISNFNWNEIKTAKVFIGDDAVKIGLVDSIMTYDEAITKAKSLSGEQIIYTRDEIKKLTDLANNNSDFIVPKPMSAIDRHPVGEWLDDTHFFAEQAKDVLNGSGISFEYMMPMKF